MISRSADTADRLFNPAMDAVRQFQKKFDEVQKFRHNLPDNERDIAAFEKLLGQFAFKHDGTAPTWDGPFKQWLVECFTIDEVPSLTPVSGRKAMAVANGESEPEVFFSDLDDYADRIQGILGRSSPASFNYQGFKIENPERMGESQCRRILEGVDYVVALFKKRGVTTLLRDTITEVRLLPSLGQDGPSRTFGFYYPQERLIELSAQMVGQGKGRFMEWVNEVFLHEVGHHVHMTYIKGEARAAWDSGWQEVKDQQSKKDELFAKISHAERLAFFNVLKDTDWDVGKASKKLKGAAKVKFGVWLRSPMVGEPLITDKQFRLTSKGKHFFRYLETPVAFLKEEYDVNPEDPDFKDRVRRKSEQIAETLGLTWAGAYSVPQGVVAEMVKADPAISKAVDEAMAKLEIVSDYGKTDEKEDFAESFVAFLGAPEKLTPTAKFRMQRTLSLSGLYGKPIMRLAFRVAARFMGMSKF